MTHYRDMDDSIRRFRWDPSADSPEDLGWAPDDDTPPECACGYVGEPVEIHDGHQSINVCANCGSDAP